MKRSPRKTLKAGHLHIRVEAEQLERWKLAARKDRRSLSSWVVVNLDRMVEA